MFGIVMVFLVIDVIYLTTWTAIDGLYRSFETVTDQPEYECFQVSNLQTMMGCLIFLSSEIVSCLTPAVCFLIYLRRFSNNIENLQLSGVNKFSQFKVFFIKEIK